MYTNNKKNYLFVNLNLIWKIRFLILHLHYPKKNIHNSITHTTHLNHYKESATSPCN